MNSRTTKWLLFLAIGLFVYIYFFERHRESAPRTEKAAERLLDRFRAEAVTSVEVLRSNQVIRVERTGGGWRLAAPAYPAQRTVVEGLLEAVGSLMRRGHVAAVEILAQGGLAAFGLEPAQATLVLNREEGPIQIRLGGRAPAGHQFYLQVVGEDGVQVVDDTVLDRLPGSADDWRDPQLFVLRGTPWDWMEIQVGQRDLRLEREAASGEWRMIRPLPARADGRMVERMVLELQATRVTRFVADPPVTDLEAYGLQTPEVVFTLGQGTNRVMTLEVGRSPSNDVSQVYVRRSVHTNVVLVARAQTAPLRTPYTAFLERHLANVPMEWVDRIEVRAAETFTVQRQTNGQWMVQKPGETMVGDRERVAGFLRDLTSLEVAEIAKDVVTELDLPSYGLAPPARSYSLFASPTNTARGTTNLLLAQVDFGSPQTNRVFGRRVDETTVYYVDRTAVVPLPETALALRDRRVWNFTTNQVTAVTFRSGGQSRKLNRSPKGEWSLPGGGPVASPLALDECLFRLGQLTALSWTARRPESLAPYEIREGETEVAVEVRVGEAVRTFTMQFGRLSPERNPYASTLLGEDRFVFEVALNDYAPFLEVLRDLKFPAPAAP